MYWYKKFITVFDENIIQRGNFKTTIEQLTSCIYSVTIENIKQKGMQTSWECTINEQPVEIIHGIGCYKLSDYWEFLYNSNMQLTSVQYFGMNGAWWTAHVTDGKLTYGSVVW